MSPLSEHVLTDEESLRLNTALLSDGQKQIYLERKDYDYALALDATHRYRVNLMFHKDGAAGSYRMVSADVPTLEIGDAQEILGVNSLADLAVARAAMQERILIEHLDRGVIIIDPAATWIDARET